VGRRPVRTSVAAEAPGRVNIIGEHLDYLGGRCLSLALDQRTTATVTLRDDTRLVVTSGELGWEGDVSRLQPGSERGWAGYVAGVVWALGVEQGMEIHLSTTLPTAAGLASSAALACAVAAAVSDALGLCLEPSELAMIAYRAETEMVGAPTGKLDQFVSMLANPGEALLVDFSEAHPTWEYLPFRTDESNVCLLVINTGVTHDMTDGSYGRRRAECSAAAAQLGVGLLAEAPSVPREQVGRLPGVLRRRTQFVLDELERVEACARHLRDGDWAAVGRVMCTGHNGARDDFEISCEQLDVAVEAACEAGALGARMTGGGFGGCAIALVTTDLVAAVRESVTQRYVARGWPLPGFLVSGAGAGATSVPLGLR
jgi:galactokinase